MASNNGLEKRSASARERAKVSTAKRKGMVARLTAALSAVVVLCTAAALMVPALSITGENTQPEAGFFGADGAGAGASAAANAAPGALAAGVAPSLTAGTEADASDAVAGDTVPAMPAATFEQTIATSDGNELTVRAEAGEGAFPEGACMLVEEVADEGVLGAAVEAAADAEAVAPEFARAVAADITFVDAQGAELQPANGDVRVSMSTGAIARQAELAVVHVDAERNAEVVDSQVVDAAAPGAAGDSVDAPAPAAPAVEFDAASFSVYAIVYTVDFSYEVDGQVYEFSFPGGGFVSLRYLVDVLGVSDDEGFVDGVVNAQFSNPELVWVGKVDAETTVGALKEANGLYVQYSADLTKEQIVEIDAQTVEAGDWVLISLQPFDTEESLTVTMGDGSQFAVKVTDDNIVVNEQIDNTEGIIIYTIKNGNYYALNSQTGNNWLLPNGESDLTTLGNDFKWTIEYVYQEKGTGVFDTGYNYYKVRSYADRSKYLYIGQGGDVVRTEATNVHIVQNPNPGQEDSYAIGGRFGLFGTYWLSALACDDNGYLYPYPANMYEYEPSDRYAPFYFYKQVETSYEFTVQTEEIQKGSVSGKDRDGQDRNNQGLFTTKTIATSSDDNKTNQYPITATPTTQRLIFDHWTLNGDPLDKVQYGAEIPVQALTIPGNGAILEAHFVKNPDYEPTPEEQEGRDAINKEAFDAWLNERIQNQQPLVDQACNKTAEVYDYENRIYRVDLTAESDMTIFDGDVDLGFIIDVSASMKFPSKLENASDIRNNTEAKNITTVNNNWRTWGMSQGKTYYVIADPDSTSTVCRLFWDDGRNEWRMQDASKSGNDGVFDPAGNNGAYWSSTSNKTLLIKEAGDLVTGNETGTIAQVIQEKGLEVGQPKTRAVYLEASIKDAIAEMYSIKQRLSVAKSQSSDYQPKIAYNQFCGYIYDAQLDFVAAPADGNVVTGYSYDGGTSTDVALLNAAGYVRSDVGAGNAYETDKKNSGYYSNWNKKWGDHSYSDGTGVDRGFQWDENSTKRYAILITDGAPQRSSRDIDGRYITEAADKLKSKGVQLVSVGLSMKDVAKGSGLLYSISDEDDLGVPYYYKAESGDKLSNVIYETLQSTIGSAIVCGQVTDTIGQAFYPVDKQTGNPLGHGDRINLDGEKVDSSYTGKCGVINVTRQMKNGKEENVYTVNWEGQDIKTRDKGGWHGTVYIKAKEDLIGGNGVETNDGKATIKPTHFKNAESSTPIELKDGYKITKELDTPRVNVNELAITKNDTAWTVYLGEEVDPLNELKRLYDKVDVIQVVNGGADTNGDGFIDRVNDDGNSQHAYNENMFYPLPADVTEMESDGREGQGSGTRQTFKLKDLIKKLQGTEELDWNKLLSEANKQGTDPDHPENMNKGIEIPYNLYGISDDSKLIIKLTKEIAAGEPDISNAAHRTKVTGDGVEKYSLIVYYEPDYKVLPTGQYGEVDIATYHVGSYGSMSQGNAAGREERENKHVINVFAKNLEISKTDVSNNNLIDTAKFKLYRTAEPNETGTVDLKVGAQTKSVVQIGDEISTSGGKAVVENLSYAPDGTYYLVETEAPAGYNMLTEPVVMHLNLKNTYNHYRSPYDVIAAEQIGDNPYNWTQTVDKFIYGSSEDGTGDSAKFVMTVKNNPGYELPHTGGPGVETVIVPGVLLIASAGALLLLRKRRHAA